MFTPDTLSRAPLPGSDPAADELIVCADNYTVAYITELPATPGKITEIKMKQQQDEVCGAAAQFSLHGWPDSSSLQGELKVLHSLSGEITVQNGLLLRGSRIVIPESLRNEILQKLHDGHLGIVKCRARAASSVWWPGLSKELKNLVENCDVCKKEKGNHSEPMIQSAKPDRPWQVLGSDLFDWKGHKYLLLVDYLSRYPEIAKLDSGTFRRNRHNIITVQGVESDSAEDDFLPLREDPEAPVPPALHPGEPPPPARPLRTRSGRQVQCPARLDL